MLANLVSCCYQKTSRSRSDLFIHLPKCLMPPAHRHHSNRKPRRPRLGQSGFRDDLLEISQLNAGRKLKRQLACKPGSVRPGNPKTTRRGDHSSWMDVAVHLTQPTRMTGLETAPRVAPRAIPIRSCSRWGLPCRFCYQSRGGLLPHPFTLTRHAGRYSLCGTFPGVAPAGR